MLQLLSLAARPDLRPQVFSEPFVAAWPKFMLHDETAELYFAQPNLDACLDTAFAVVDSTHPEVAVGRAFAVPFAFGGPGREQLPDGGWDAVIRWAHEDRMLGRSGNVLSALEITLLPSHRGQGGSGVVLSAMADHARALGYRELFAPVRPTAKNLEPFTPIGDYAFRTRDDGLPFDPWLRVHVRAGGTIVKVAPASMVIVGTLDDWTQWTGLAFGSSGQHAVPEALVPVHISVEQDHGVYVEPNVWLRHSLAPLRSDFDRLQRAERTVSSRLGGSIVKQKF
jgi:GNAT superfamily N-acetyltransferase